VGKKINVPEAERNGANIKDDELRRLKPESLS